MRLGRSKALTAGVGFITTILLPRFPKLSKYLPGPAAGIIAAVCFSAVITGLDWYPQQTIGHLASKHTFEGGFKSLPPWNIPPAHIHWDDFKWGRVIEAGVHMAIIGLIESLMTLTLVDQITETRGSTTRECFGQCLGNAICGCFGVQGGCALVGQTLINIGGGGRGHRVLCR